MSAAAVVVAGGEGRRLGGERKQFRPIGGTPVLAWCCGAFARHAGIEQVVAVVPGDAAETPPAWLSGLADRIVAGGASRRASVRAGLAAVDDRHAVVLVHDGARPFLSADLLDRILAGSDEGPVIPALPITDTVKMVGDDDRVRATLDRGLLRGAQTPQAFPLALLRELHADAEAREVEATDDAFLCERAGIPVRVVPGEPWNVKVTTPFDLAMARWWVESGLARAAGVRAPAGR